MTDLYAGALIGFPFGIIFGVVVAIAVRVWMWSGE